MDIGYSHRTAVMLMYMWTAVLSFGGLAFAVYPWQIVLAVDLMATTGAWDSSRAWPYLSRRSADTAQ